jgi:hypothetical protein
MIKYFNNEEYKKIITFSDFIYKIYNYYLVNFDNFYKNLINQKVNINFIYCIMIRGILLIEKIFIYNIYINNSIQNLQNISKKVIDLYLKFMDQLISMNININLSIKDAEIFIYKKFIDKSINDFNRLSEIDKIYIEIIKLNNTLLLTYITVNEMKIYNSSNILIYSNTFFKDIKNNYKINKINKIKSIK